MGSETRRFLGVDENGMPLTKMTCPHCEEEFQAAVASVTRSRPCPSCGKEVLLRVAEGSKKRSALLVKREGFSEPMPVAKLGLPYLPQALTEEEVNSQRNDPESRLLLMKLGVGLVGVILLGGLMILANGMEGDEVGGIEEVMSGAGRVVKEEVVVAEVRVPEVKKIEAPVAKSGGVKGFEGLFRERPSRPVVLRVWATEGSMYGGVFGDSEWLRCVDLRAADDAEGRVMRAYVVRTSDTGGAVDFLLRQAGSERQQWTVKVRYPPGAEEPNQVWLDELVAGSWEPAEGK